MNDPPEEETKESTIESLEDKEEQVRLKVEIWWHFGRKCRTHPLGSQACKLPLKGRKIVVLSAISRITDSRRAFKPSIRLAEWKKPPLR